MSRAMFLKDAKKYRLCPPDEVWGDPRHAEAVKYHQRICIYCAERGDGMNPWEFLIQTLMDAITPPPAVLSPPQPGEFRYIRPEQAAWRDGYFYSPPMVLVLERAGGISDAFRVMQVYHDMGLAGPGDLLLTEEQTGLGFLFVETWNQYTVKADYLGPTVGKKLPPEILSDAQKMAQEPEYLPSWTMLTWPLAKEDPRIYFRKMEIEVGYIFAEKGR